MNTQSEYEPGQLVWYRDEGFSDTGIVTYVDPETADGYGITVLFASDMSEDQYHARQLGTFTAPDHL